MKIEMDRAMLTALRLSKEGFGPPTQILKMPVNVVLAALHYVNFLADYEIACHELNQPK